MSAVNIKICDTINKLGQNAYNAKFELQKLSEAEKNSVLLKVADALVEKAEDILTANDKDIKQHKVYVL